LAAKIGDQASGKGLDDVLPRSRRLMLEARANLEQWRVAVSRNDVLEEGEREVIQSVMGVARRDAELSYSMVAKGLSGRAGMETLEYALRRTAQAMMAVLIELVKIAPSGDVVADMQEEDLRSALRTRAAYGQLVVAIEAVEGPIEARLDAAHGLFNELISGSLSNDIRIADVSVFQGLLDRITDWQAERSKTPGEALWSEVMSVGSLIRGINQRETLRNHDRRVLARIVSGDPIESHRTEANPLLGLDAALDRLLVGSGSDPEVRDRVAYLAAAIGL
ncbi:MAG: hypothetical protein AAFX94_24275, partial [Myxococcota bacterium]